MLMGQDNLAAAGAPRALRSVVRPGASEGETAPGEHAAACAVRGWHVFPCDPTTKKPLTDHGHLDATTDVNEIRGWWRKFPGAMIGCATGPKSGFWALDADRDETAGKDGVAALAQLGALPETVEQATPRGGQHKLFRWDPKRPVKNSVSRLGPGIDTRGDGGYIILAPSARGDGASYSWTRSPASFEIVDAPEWLYDEIRRKRPEPEQSTPNALAAESFPFESDEITDTAARIFREQCGKVAATERGRRNDALNKASFTLGRFAALGEISIARATEGLLWAAGECGLSDDDGEAGAKATIASGLNAAMQEHRDFAARWFDSLVSTSFKSVAIFCAEYIPPSYAIDPIVRSASLYTLTAKTGAGKTAFNVVAALAVATGRKDILDREVCCGRVAYLACENPDDIRMRIMIAAFRFGIDLAGLGDRIVILDRREKPEKVAAELARLARVEPFALVIVDTLAGIFDGDNINDNVEGGDFMRRLRPLTQIEGRPSVLVSAHPVKNAGESALIPYGGGAILNEVDGNLTLWKEAESGIVRLHWQGKLRGLEFEPIPFRFEISGALDILDAKGRMVQLPTLRPTSEPNAEEKQQSDHATDVALLQAMIAAPGKSIREYATAIGCPKSAIERKLVRLAREKVVKKVLGKWGITPEGRRAVKEPPERPPV